MRGPKQYAWFFQEDRTECFPKRREKTMAFHCCPRLRSFSSSYHNSPSVMSSTSVEEATFSEGLQATPLWDWVKGLRFFCGRPCKTRKPERSEKKSEETWVVVETGRRRAPAPATLALAVAMDGRREPRALAER
ncbi:hypothetical protein SDJN02_23826 [Cucurbita argyrosperma subsp. argyrosperma]|nr:hypothetical protein SDJN02_23826 [Cucurbita argyrosperma subsp. argyrosperma]